MSLNKMCGFNFGFCVIFNVAMKIFLIVNAAMKIPEWRWDCVVLDKIILKRLLNLIFSFECESFMFQHSTV